MKVGTYKGFRIYCSKDQAPEIKKSLKDFGTLDIKDEYFKFETLKYLCRVEKFKRVFDLLMNGKIVLRKGKI